MKYFTISEMIHNGTAVERKIWNGADKELENNLTALIENVLDPARERYGKPIRVSSGFRCPKLNSAVGGALQSQHMKGEAADIYTDEGPQGNLELGRIIMALGKFDQLIFENVPGTHLLPQWLHVSWKRGGGNRKDVRKKVIGSNSYPLVERKEVLGV